MKSIVDDVESTLARLLSKQDLVKARLEHEIEESYKNIKNSIPKETNKPTEDTMKNKEMELLIEQDKHIVEKLEALEDRLHAIEQRLNTLENKSAILPYIPPIQLAPKELPWNQQVYCKGGTDVT